MKRKEATDLYTAACKAAKESLADWDDVYLLKEVTSARSSAPAGLAIPKHHDLSEDEARRREIHDYKRAWIFRQFSARCVPGHLKGVEPQQKQLMELLERTLTQHQNNAVLLLGYRGCGKSAILRSVLADLRKKYHPQGSDFCEIYLNGRYQTDDSMAIREIVRQLQTEYDRYEDLKPRQFTDEVSFLTTLLKDSTYARLPVFFILDEFHEFAKENARQTLLYLLGDLLQDKACQIAIIGLSCRVDAHEFLEKRVRSRMSYAHIVVGHLPTVQLLQQSIQEALCLPLIPAVAADQPASDFPDPKKISNEDILHHNRCVDEFVQSSVFMRKLQHIHAVGRDHRWIQSALGLTLRKWKHPDQDFPVPQLFVESCDYLSRDSMGQSLQTCSIAQLVLVATILHLELQNITTYNFKTIFSTYQAYMRANEPDSIDNFSKSHMFGVFETLLYSGLVIPSSRNLETYTKHTDLVLKQTENVRLALANSRAREALSKCKLPTWLDNWVKRGGGTVTW